MNESLPALLAQCQRQPGRSAHNMAVEICTLRRKRLRLMLKAWRRWKDVQVFHAKMQMDGVHFFLDGHF